MAWRSSRSPVMVAVCAAGLLTCTFDGITAQQAGQPPAGGGRGGGRGNVAPALFTAADTNKDGSVSREELKATFDKWFSASEGSGSGVVTRDQLQAALTAALPPPPPPPPPQPAPQCGGRSANPRTACPDDVERMMAALPQTAPAKPRQPRKILVLAKANGFVHSSIPLAARMVEEMGKKTGAWTSTLSWESDVVTADNLKQYDAIFLDSTTGAFLDDPNDAGVSAARKKALLEFVRGGKGLIGIHAATDSYHGNPASTGRAGGGGGGGGGRGGGAAATIATQITNQGDRNSDQKLSRDEVSALADAWFDKLDPDKAGTVSQQDFSQRFAAVNPPPAAPALIGPVVLSPTLAGQPAQVNAGLWPEFNTMIGGWFKHHWNDPQLIVVKIDDPKHPITAPFKGQSFDINDETYTFPMDSWSRGNVRVLTSVDYSKMSEADKAHEPASSKRTDGDYGLSWIRREGKGRVFYEAHGHNERVYAIRPMLEHILAGVQYALGDLQADDSPSAKPGTQGGR
jgi:type 1 glutamine amidotransferase